MSGEAIVGGGIMQYADWRLRAACRDAPLDRHFPHHRPGEESLKPCESCPVRAECLEFALSSPWKPEGIWAGMTTPQVQAAWRRRHPRQSYSEALVLLGLK